jgi:hypothetical protein
VSAMHVLIHQFTNSAAEPSFDDEGDERIGSYYQWVDQYNRPRSQLIGPYATNKEAEKAAHRAYLRRDFI